MAIYYAVVQDNTILIDVYTEQLEIYETKKHAQMNCPKSCNVIAVSIKINEDT